MIIFSCGFSAEVPCAFALQVNMQNYENIFKIIDQSVSL